MARKRISLTLAEELVDKIDREKEKNKINNRSRAVETFLKEYFESKSIRKAVILCGGDEKPPKCAEKAEKKRIIERKLEHLEASGVSKVIIATDREEKEIEKILDKDEYDLSIEVSIEETPLGTAGCLKPIKEELNETFILTNGDVVCNIDVEDMLKIHRKNSPEATMALTTTEETSNYGVVNLKGNKIVGFEEKPEKASTKLINAGFYILEPEIIGRIERKESKKVEIEQIFEELADEDVLKGYVYEGEWHDYGN